MYYLGKHGSDASRREYDRIIGEFVANGRQPFYRQDEILVESLIVRYLDHVETELNMGESRKNAIKYVLRALNELYGKQPASLFSPTALKSLRRRWIENGLGRSSINLYVSIVRQVFDWGGEEEIVPADTVHALRMVKQLKRGQTAAVEYASVQPVERLFVD